MDAATAGFLGTIAGGLIGTATTLITKIFDEKKARRELMQKTAFDYWQTAFQAATTRGKPTVPFEASFLLAVQIMELAERKDLSEDVFVSELKKLRDRHNIIVGEWMRTRGPTEA